jgi:hypothetical protein
MNEKLDLIFDDGLDVSEDTKTIIINRYRIWLAKIDNILDNIKKKKSNRTTLSEIKIT